MGTVLCGAALAASVGFGFAFGWGPFQVGSAVFCGAMFMYCLVMESR